MRHRPGFSFAAFLFSLLIIFVPVNDLKTTFFVNNQTPSLALPDDRRGIEFPVVRQQLHKIEMFFNNLCESSSLGTMGTHLFVSTALNPDDSRVLKIARVENYFAILFGGESVFEGPVSEVFRDNCTLHITIQGSKLSLSATEVFEIVQLADVPKFSLLVVDEKMLRSGDFTAALTTETYGIQLSLLATSVRIVCLLFLLLLIMQLHNSQLFKKVIDA